MLSIAHLAGKIEAFVYNEHVLNVALRAYPHRLKVLDDAVAAFSFWFSAFLVEAGESVRSWLAVSRVKLVELMQWTSVVGSISLCDLTMAADIV